MGLRAGLCLVFLGFVFGASGSRVRAEWIERVVATVDDDPIFLSELRARAVPFLPRAMQGGTPMEREARVAQLYEQLLNHLIEEKLIEQAARRMEVQVATADIERAIANVRRQNQLSETDFWQAVGQQGFTETQYREDVRRQLLRLKVMNQRVRGRINLTNEDVRERYEQETRRARRESTFRAKDVFVRIPEHATATDVARARERTTQIRAHIDAETFDALMDEIGGGDLGLLRQGDLPAELADALLVMSPGEISAPIQTPQGFHLLMLVERQQGPEVPTFDAVREQLYRQMVEENMARHERAFLDELRRTAAIETHLAEPEAMPENEPSVDVEPSDPPS